MIQVSVYNIDGKEVEKINVPNAIFGAEWKPELVHQAVITQQANSRNIVAHAKTRAEVRGGGKKPWKQKGTGRARHGSIRSPLWIGGGATHGPLKEKVYARKINKKMKQTALFSALSKQYNEGKIYIVDQLPANIKTKAVISSMKNVLNSKQSTLFVFSNESKNLYKAVRNIDRVSYCGPSSLNVFDILKQKKIVLEKNALDQITNHYKLAKKSK